MPGFVNPLWFVLLAAVPLIRWLHLWQSPMSTWPVSALFLWDESQQHDAAGQTKQKPDPAWRRRALAVALLATALAGPFWQQDVRSLTVWVDDSLSMATLENGETRLATSLTMLVGALDKAGHPWSEIHLRSLSKPARTLQYSGRLAPDPDEWPLDESATVLGPPASLMSGASSHWLLTDGASAAVRSWARRVPIERVIQSGSATENVAVTRLAARQSLSDEGGFDVLVSVSNQGLATDTRQLVLLDGSRQLQSRDFSLAPGQTIDWQTHIPHPAQSLQASLKPGDALLEDDGLTITRDRFEPLATAIDKNCPAALQRALRMHPSLRPSDSPADAALLVSCPRQRFPDLRDSERQFAGARLRVLLAEPAPVAAAPTWMPLSDANTDFMLAREWVAAAPWPDRMANAADRVLLSSGPIPLVVLRDQASTVSNEYADQRVVDTVVDMNNPQFVRQPEYAAFVAALVDAATERKLLDEVISASRDAQASRVFPELIGATASLSAIPKLAAKTPLSLLFVLAAILLLALDTAVIVRARRETRRA